MGSCSWRTPPGGSCDEAPPRARDPLRARRAFAEPLRETHYGLPRDVSLDGHRIDELIHFTLVGSVLVFVVVAAVMVYALVRHRRSHATLYTHGSRGSVGVLLGFVGLVTVAVDGNLFIHTLED